MGLCISWDKDSFQFGVTQAGTVEFELGFEKNNLLGNGIRTPLRDQGLIAK